jgi:hypothetical protein
VSFHPCHERRALQARILPELRAVVRRHEPVLQEWVVDLAPGREVVDLLAPLAELPPVRLPSGPPTPCAHCHGQRRILEPGPLGYIAVVCGRCHGAGMDPS